MNVIVDLTEEQLRNLSEKAKQLSTSPEQLVERLVLEFANERSVIDFDSAMNYVLNKNKELYERLAK